MEAAENVGRSKTLNAGSATLIFLTYFIAAILTVVLAGALAGASRLWLVDILYPIFGFLAMVLSAIALIPADIKMVGPTGPAWVLGRWENLAKGLAIGCTIGAVSHLWDLLNRSHLRHDEQFQSTQLVEPINRAVVTPGAEQALAIVALVLLGPALEEMMFRGVLYGGYRKSFGPISAALVATGLFVAIHFPNYIYAPYKIVFYFAGALALLWCRLHWNAIGPAIAAHGGINFAAVVVPALFLTWQHAFYDSGVAAYKASNFKQAIASLTHAIELGDKSPGIYVYRGNARYEEGDMDGAISDYSSAIELNPADKQAFYDRGLAKGRNADFDGAIADYDEAITLNANYTKAYHDRGLAKESETNFDAAIADFTRAIELSPTNSYYYNDRAWAEFMKGDFGYSIGDATRSIQLDPDSGAAYGTRGWARYSVGDVSGAVEDCKMSTQLNKPGSTPFFADQGMLDFISNDYTHAIADWQNAIQKDPDSKNELQPWIEKAQKLADGKVENSSNGVDQTETTPKR
jgi:tetratricopeptide (TPR) repeat protein